MVKLFSLSFLVLASALVFPSAAMADGKAGVSFTKTATNGNVFTISCKNGVGIFQFRGQPVHKGSCSINSGGGFTNKNMVNQSTGQVTGPFTYDSKGNLVQ